MSFVANALASALNFECKKCGYNLNGTDLAAAESQIKRGLLVCPKCQAIIEIAGRPGVGGIDKSKIVQSARISLKNDGGKVAFAVPWRGQQTYAILSIAILFLAPVTTVAHQHLSRGESIVKLLPFLVPSIGALLWSLISLVNKTHVYLDARELRVFRSPISFGGRQVFSTKEISNFSVQQKVGHTSKGAQPECG